MHDFVRIGFKEYLLEEKQKAKVEPLPIIESIKLEDIKHIS